MTQEALSPEGNLPAAEASGAPQVSWCLLGFGLFWAWDSVTAFSGVLIPMSAPYLIKAHMLTALGATTVTLALAASLASRSFSLARYLRWRYVFFVGPFCAVLATSLIVLARDTEAGISTGFLVGSALNGVGFAWFALSWGALYSIMEPGRANVHLLASWAVGAAVCLFVVSLQPVQAIVATILLPMLSGAMYLISTNRLKVADTECNELDRRGKTSMPLRLMVGVGVFGVVSGAMTGMVSSDKVVDFASANILFISIGLIALVALVISLSARNKDFLLGAGSRSRYRLALPLVVSGFLVSSFADVNGNWRVAHTLVTVGLLSLDMLVWNAVVLAAHHSPTSRISVIGWGRAAVFGGTLVGILIGSLVGDMAADNPEVFRLSSLAAVLLVVLDASFVLRESDLVPVPSLADKSRAHSPNTADSMAPPKALIEEVINAHLSSLHREFASLYGLSNRETEVFSLLLKGRDAAHIQSALYISRGTMNTHKGAIYRKTEVHSHQELIDRYEDWLAAKTKSFEPDSSMYTTI